MFIVTGANGQTGSVVAKTLLDARQPVRVIVRHAEQAAAWKGLGAQAAIADLTDRDALISAFEGATSAYLMNPPAYQHADLFARARGIHSAMIAAAEASHLQHVVALSSVGAQHAHGTGNILTTHDFEQQLAKSRLTVHVLRASNFMENWASSLPVAMQNGILPSMFHPIERALPMVSAKDIGAMAAQMMMDRKQGMVELHGPQDYSPKDAADALSQLIGKHVEAKESPRAGWADIFARISGSPISIQAFCEMFDGFNSGLVRFEGTHETRRGKISLSEALHALLNRTK